MENFTLALEAELEKRLANIDPTKLKAEFKRIYAEASAKVSKKLNKIAPRKQIVPKKVEKQYINRSNAIVTFYAKLDNQVGHYRKTARDVLGNKCSKVFSYG